MRFFTPGPTHIPKEAFRVSNMHHREKDFSSLYASVREKLKMLSGQEVALLSGSGTLGIEAMLSNTLKGRKLYVFINGEFGERLFKQALFYKERLKGIEAIRLEEGKSYTLSSLIDEYGIDEKDAIAGVEGETSVAVMNNIFDNKTKAFVDEGGLLLVDRVSSFPLTDGFGFSATASQKFLSAFPGVAIVFLPPSPNLYNAPTYLNLNLYISNRPPFTPSIQSIQSLNVTLSMLEQEGLTNFRERHIKASNMARKRIAEMGFPLIGENHPGITAFLCNNKEERDKIREGLKRKGFLIANLKGSMKDRGLRIGHMGFFSLDELNALLDALGEVKDSL